MDDELFKGEHVRLGAASPAARAEAFHRWNQNTEYFRLLDNDPATLFSKKIMQEWMEKGLEKTYHPNFFFTIHLLEDEKPIGFTSLWNLHWDSGDGWVSIALGEPEYWGKGYGTEAMRLLLRYAFTELNLHRVTLFLFEYNPRAMRSYEKAGFRVEGRTRQVLRREGRTWDGIYMGILRSEWEQVKAGRLVA